jgi:uncharacterized coiled-coil protein SlyX
MTRLTEQRIAETFNAYKPTWMGGWDFLGGDTADSMRGFARAIAALAVQEVERERDIALEQMGAWRRRAMNQERDIATLTAQLAEVTKERDGARVDLDRLVDERGALRAQLATAKRDSERLDGLAQQIRLGGSICLHTGDFSERQPSRGLSFECDATGNRTLRGALDLFAPATPSPEAREVPSEAVILRIIITPADAKRIVALGTE